MTPALKALTVSSDPLFPKILNQALAQHGVELVDVATVTQAKNLLAVEDFCGCILRDQVCRRQFSGHHAGRAGARPQTARGGHVLHA